MAENFPVNPNQLNGWKEIAAYVGRSVRGAQRWERELGLPVHRIKTPRGQVIYALKSEIETWRRQLEGALFGEGPEAAAERPAHGEPGGRTSPVDWRRRLVFGIAASAGAIVLAAVAVPKLGSGSDSEPARFELRSGRLYALDASARIRWIRDLGPFSNPADSTSESFTMDLTPDRRLAKADLDGDGRGEVITAVPGRLLPSGASTSWRLLVFSPIGKQLWEYTPDVVLAFSHHTYGNPWFFSDLLVAPPGQAPAIWAATVHNTWWPSFVVRVDAKGHAAMRFLNSGHVYRLAWWRPPAPSAARSPTSSGLVVAGGVNNEYGCAAAAVFDADTDAGVSPQSPGSPYALKETPRGGPLRYFLFPRSEVQQASGFPYNRVTGLATLGDRVQVSVQELADRPSSTCNLFYELAPDLRVHSAAWSDGCAPAHRQLEREGRLDHPLEACPERHRPRRIRVWDPESGWTEYTVPIVYAPAPGLDWNPPKVTRQPRS